MKEENEIDQLFQSGLPKNYAFDEQLWKQVETQLPSAKKQHPFWHFNLNSVPLFAIILACAFLQTDTTKPLYANSQLSNDPPKVQELDEAYSITKPTPEISENNLVKNSSLSFKKEREHSSNESQLLKTTQNTTASSQLNQKVAEKKNTPLVKMEEKNEQLDYQNQQKSIQAELNTIAPYITSKRPERGKSKQLQQSILFIEPSGFFHKIYPLTAMPISNKDNDKLHQLQEKLKPNYLYFEVEAYRSVAIDKKLAGENQQFIDYKMNSESPLYREGLGINIFRDIKWLNIGIGVHYNTFVERANYSYNEEQSNFESTYDTSYQLVNSNFSSNGNPVFLIEENIDETVTESKVLAAKQLKVRNEFKRLQVPVIFGYRQHIGRWTAGIQTAFVFNYLAESNGIYVQENLDNFKDFSDKKQFNSLVYSQKNQLNLGFSLSEFVLIGGRFSYEYDLNSFTKEYDSKFQSYNLGLWLQWRP